MTKRKAIEAARHRSKTDFSGPSYLYTEASLGWLWEQARIAVLREAAAMIPSGGTIYGWVAHQIYISTAGPALKSEIAAACRHFYGQGRKDEFHIYSNAIDPQLDVRQFMAAFNQTMPATPQWPDQETMDLRVRLVAEEFCEWLRDSGYDYELAVAHPGADGYDVVECGWTYAKCRKGDPVRSLPKSADALIDQMYVIIGTLLAMGIDMWPLWREVQRANMAKVGGPVVDGKVRKPAGWSPPDIDALLRNQGWEGEDA